VKTRNGLLDPRHKWRGYAQIRQPEPDKKGYGRKVLGKFPANPDAYPAGPRSRDRGGYQAKHCGIEGIVVPAGLRIRPIDGQSVLSQVVGPEAEEIDQVPKDGSEKGPLLHRGDRGRARPAASQAS